MLVIFKFFESAFDKGTCQNKHPFCRRVYRIPNKKLGVPKEAELLYFGQLGGKKSPEAIDNREAFRKLFLLMVMAKMFSN